MNIGALLLIAHERAAGRRVLACGDVPWLVASDWRAEPVVSVSGRDVRIVAIWARTEGAGTFRRLVEAIEAEGMVPVVVEPFAHMRAILTRWGWRRARVGGEEQWRPPKRRRKCRADIQSAAC